MSEKEAEVFGDQSSESEGDPMPVMSSDESQEVVEQQPEEQESGSFVKRLMKKKRPRNRQQQPNEKEEDMIDTVLVEAGEAAKLDVEANQNELPALNKLKMLDRFVKLLQISKYHETMLDMNICSVLRDWLAQLPDRSFPSLSIRTRLLEAIQDLPITVEHLGGSELGKSVMAIYKNPQEKPNVKKLAKNLIDKWSRNIYEIDTDYSRSDKFEVPEEGDTVNYRHEPTLHNILSKESSTKYTRIPSSNLYDFKYMPQPKLPQHKTTKEDSSIDRVKKRFSLKKKRSRSTAKMSEMSVDGKNLS